MRPTDGGVGAEVVGVDLRRLDAAAFAAIRRAWVAHGVLLFRGQSLTDDDLIAFSRRFGDLDLAPVQETGRRFVAGHPEIYVVSNVIENGVPIGSLGAGEAVWHTDMSYLPAPPMASLLYALEVPPRGRRHLLLPPCMRALERLPPALRRRVAGLRVKHDGTYNSGGYVRQGVTPTDDPRDRARHAASAGLPPPGVRAGDAVSRPPPQRLTSTGWSLRSWRRCWTRCGPHATRRRDRAGGIAGGSATWCCGTIAAPCTAATRSTRRAGGSCTARR